MHVIRVAPAQPNGAELLCSIINSFFSRVVDIVHKYGGDIIKVRLTL